MNNKILIGIFVMFLLVVSAVADNGLENSPTVNLLNEEGYDDIFAFRFNYKTGRVETRMSVTQATMAFGLPTSYRDDNWWTKTTPGSQQNEGFVYNKGVSITAKTKINHVLDAKSEKEMRERIAEISRDADFKIGYPPSSQLLHHTYDYTVPFTSADKIQTRWAQTNEDYKKRVQEKQEELLAALPLPEGALGYDSDGQIVYPEDFIGPLPPKSIFKPQVEGAVYPAPLTGKPGPKTGIVEITIEGKTFYYDAAVYNKNKGETSTELYLDPEKTQKAKSWITSEGDEISRQPEEGEERNYATFSGFDPSTARIVAPKPVAPKPPLTGAPKEELVIKPTPPVQPTKPAPISNTWTVALSTGETYSTEAKTSSEAIKKIKEKLAKESGITVSQLPRTLKFTAEKRTPLTEKEKRTYKVIGKTVWLGNKVVKSYANKPEAEEAKKRLQAILNRELAAKEAAKGITGFKKSGFVDQQGIVILTDGKKYISFDSASGKYSAAPKFLYKRQTLGDGFAEIQHNLKGETTGVVNIWDEKRSVRYQTTLDALNDLGAISKTARLEVTANGMRAFRKDTLILEQKKEDRVVTTNSQFKNGQPYRIVQRGEEITYDGKSHPFYRTQSFKDITLKVDRDGDGKLDIERQIVSDEAIIFTKEKRKLTNIFGTKYEKDYDLQVRVKITYETDPKTGVQLRDKRILLYTDQRTREPLKVEAGGLIFDYSGEKIKVTKDGADVTEAAVPDKYKQYLTEHAAWKAGQYFSAIRYSLTDFVGFGYYSKLFFDDETLDNWRESVDEVFASAYLGTDYWTSDICAVQYDKTLEGVAFVETPGGLITPAAHIEARISSVIENPNGTADYLYQVTAHVKTYEEDAVFNIVLSNIGEGLNLFDEPVRVKEGRSYTAAGETSIVKYLQTKYTIVCIDFIESEFKEDLCNDISGGIS